MACKNDESWEGAYVYKDNCVKWGDLTSLREDFNTLWDLLKKEEKHDGVKYGYRSETEKSVREQLEELATIEGFFGLRYDETQTLDEIYFYITGGTILERIKGLATQYSYDHAPVSTNFGPWIVWLKDACHGCTVFRFQNNDISYPRSIVCNYNYIANIDNDAWRLQCIWSWNGCNYPAEVLGDWQQYCHINWDWRDPNYWQQYLRDVADKLFVKGPICVKFDEPCTVTRRWCCGLYAIAHYTEDCNFNGPCEEYPGYVCRRLKYVSLGVTTSNPGEDTHGYFVSSQIGWDEFFCCPNQITGGQLKGHVSQKISAIHLTDIWDRTNKMVGGKELRKCFYNKCKYYQSNDKKERWIHKESVPMYASGTTADIMDRKESCENCEKAAVGQSICACNFNDINAMLGEYNAATCSCENEGANKGKSLTSFGSVTDCNCCKAKCCCDCQCSEVLTKEECEKKQCKKSGPKWVGIYEKGQSKDDKKLGDTKPCGCYEGGSEPDPPFPDTSCMEVCGKTSACCDPKTCTCSQKTKCECDDDKGEWQGFRSSDGSYKGTSWKKGDPKRCGDEDILEKVSCGAKGACCGQAANESDCYCSETTECECKEQKGTWKGVGSKCETFEKSNPGCGQQGKCCVEDESGYECTCFVSTKCSCDASNGTWTADGNCDSPCPNLPKGSCCAPGTCSCSGECPGSDCTPEDGCCCDSLCYTECNDCCDFASARACCSGFPINSLFEDIDDYETSVFILEDQALSDLYKIHNDYTFVTNAFDLLLMSSVYIYETASIKLSNYSRLIYLQLLIQFYEFYNQNNGAISEEDLNVVFEQSAQSNFYYAQLYRNLKKSSNKSENLKLDEDLFVEFSLMRSSVFEKLKELKLI